MTKTLIRKTELLNKVKLAYLLIGLLLMNTALAEEVCRYEPGKTMFRCNDVLPNIVIMPGTKTNLTIYCCLTGDNFEDIESEVIINVINNQTYRKRDETNNETLVYITYTDLYKASNWIESMDYPETVKAFETFPVTVNFNIPAYDNEFLPGVLFRAKFEVMVDIAGGMAPNIAVLPGLIISQDYKPINIIVIGLSIIAVSIAGIIIIKKLKSKSKMKKALQRKPIRQSAKKSTKKSVKKSVKKSSKKSIKKSTKKRNT